MSAAVASSPPPAAASSAPPITAKKVKDPEINKLFREQIKHNGSDLHLQCGKPAILRIRGTLRELNMPPIPEELMYRMFYEIMDARNRQIFEENGGADLAHVVPDADGRIWRFRVNLFKQLGQPGMVARKIEQSIPNFEGLYLPPIMEELCKFD